jgi:predicted permease
VSGSDPGTGGHRPPRLAGLLLRFLPRASAEFIRGDLDERFDRRIRDGSPVVVARLRYWRDAIASLAAVSLARPGRWNGSPATPAPPGSGGSAGGWRNVFGGLRADVRFAARALRKRPVYTGLGVAMLAIGVGATTAVFSIADAMLFRPLPGLSEPDRLAVIEFVAEGASDRSTGVSLPDMETLGAASSFAGVAGNASLTLQVLTARGDAFTAIGEAVAGDYFGVLGVRPLLGRLLSADELAASSDPSVAVIGEAFWARVYGSDPMVVGQTLRVNGQALTIVGVAGGGFAGIELRRAIEIWVPISAYPGLRHFPSLDLGRAGRSFFQQVIGRLADGVSFEAGQAELRAIFAGLVEQQPETYERYVEYVPTVYPGVGIEPFVRERTRLALGIMFAVVAFVLLIACANVANLLLFRGVHRRGELAVRRALGASGVRVARQSLVESLLIAGAGAVCGLLIARWATALFSGASLARLPAQVTFSLDARILLFTIGTAVVTAMVFGMAPAVLAAREDPGGVLRSAGSGARGRARLRAGLSVLQLALTMTLLVSALLLLRTVRKLYAVEVGFDPTSVVAFRVDPEPQGYEAADGFALYDRLIDQVGSAAGVERVSASTHPPFVGSRMLSRVRPAEEAEPVPVDVDYVGPGFFATLDVPLIRGRELTAADLEPGTAVVIDDVLARRLFGSTDVVGRTLRAPGGASERTIVGVVSQVSYSDPTRERRPTMFEPLTQSYTSGGFLLIRARLALADLDTLVANALRSLDPAIPVAPAQRLSDGLDDQLSEQRLFARLLAVFAFVALFLSAVGLYALISHSVAGRTREFGVRVALGALRGRIVALVIGEAGLVTAVGVACGSVGAYAFGRVLDNRLFGVTASDPATWAFAAAVFGAVTFLAALVPALAATRVDPIDALRTE